MSRIDELQRLHEVATPGEWFQDEDESHWLLASHHLFPKPDGIFLAQFGGESMDTPRPNDVEAIVALHNSWPAIHRVLLAAREVAANEADDIDSRLRYVEVRPGRDEWRELVEALRALDGGKGRRELPHDGPRDAGAPVHRRIARDDPGCRASWRVHPHDVAAPRTEHREEAG